MQPDASFSALFDPRRNGLNAVRLLLAASVIVWHAFPLGGTELTIAPLKQLLSQGGVDAFFAISGYLIVSSWMRRPDWRAFLAARSLRILPGFWICLALTAAVIAPLAILATDGGLPSGYFGGAVRYVVQNAALYIAHYGIAGTPSGVPYPDVWNGAIWTLMWEFLCYLGVLVLGIAGLLRRRWTIPVLFVGALAGVLVTSYGPVGNYWLVNGSRFGVMFLAGAMVLRFSDRIPVRGWSVAVAGLLLVGATALPDYRVVAALPLAFLVLCLGARLTAPAFRLENDVSYGMYIYGFPVAQVLALAGAYRWGTVPFAVLTIVITVPVAAASWFLVEKRALRLKRRLERIWSRPSVAIADQTGVGSAG